MGAKRLMTLVAMSVARFAPGAGPEAAPATRPDEVVADFESPTYGSWAKTGDAFGDGPAQGALAGQMSVSGFEGKGLVNTFFHGDSSQGTLTSPPLQIDRPFINFLIGGGNHPNETCINLLVGGKVVRTNTGRDSEALDWATWEVREFAGKSVTIKIVDRHSGSWGHLCVDQIVQSDMRREPVVVTSPEYAETYRPQFHFTSRTGWLNDPNGLVFDGGAYHLFFQHNPKGNVWGNMTWGHAVSADLLHWKQLPDAIEPDKLGTIFSGSAVVDWKNTAGFATGDDKPLIAMYTAAGSSFTQCLAYSNDHGRTFTKYAMNPVLGNVKGQNRDPKLVWDKQSHKWILALFIDGETYALFASSNLKDWKHLQDVPMSGCGECPDFFPIEISGDEHAHKWVLTAANGQYFVGDFDGNKFTPDSPRPLRVEYGRHDYAVQSYSDLPATDARRIQIAWMNGGIYPQMPFNQQMSIPCELTLHREGDGLRLWKAPVREVESLRGAPVEVKDLDMSPGTSVAPDVSGDLLDIVAELNSSKEGADVAFNIFGQELRLNSIDKRTGGLGDAPLPMDDFKLTLRILVDRTSIEAFINDGRVAISSCYLPARNSKPVEVTSKKGSARLKLMRIYPLKSVWPLPATQPVTTP